MIKGKATNAARWFKEHEMHGLEIKPVQGVHGLNNYVCMKCKRGLITTQRPGDAPVSGQEMFGRMMGNGVSPDGAR